MRIAGKVKLIVICSLICVFQEGLEWALKNISSVSKK